MTNGNERERERFEKWAFDMGYRNFTYSEEIYEYTVESIQRTWLGWQGAMSVCADGGKDIDAIECAIQVLRQVEAGDGVSVGQCSDAIAKLEAMTLADGGKDSSDHKFKNFHRLLCERFGYTHDEVDWKRDQVSLIEWIAKQVDGGKGEAVVSVCQCGPTCQDSGEVCRYTAPQAECAPREAQPIYQVRPRNGEEWTDVSEAEYKICGGAGYVQRVIYVVPTPEREPRKYVETQPGSPNFDGAEAYEAHLNAECAPREAQPVTDEVLEFAIALEQERALHIVRAVREQGFSKSESGIPTQAESVFDLACEEIEHRLRAEVWELDGIAAPTPERAQESAGVLTEDQIREIWMRETGTTEQDSPLAILDFARAVIAANQRRDCDGAQSKEPQ